MSSPLWLLARAEKKEILGEFNPQKDSSAGQLPRNTYDVFFSFRGVLWKMLFLYTPRNFFFVLFRNPLMTDRLVGFMLPWAASFHCWWRPILVAIKLPEKSVAGPCNFQGHGIMPLQLIVPAKIQLPNGSRCGESLPRWSPKPALKSRHHF